MSLNWSRRTFLQAAGAGGVGFALAGAIGAAPATADTATDAFATVRSRWATLTSGGSIDAGNPVYVAAIAALNTSTAKYLPLMETSPGATQLFVDLPLGSNADNVASSFYRLGTLARAYVTPGTAYAGSASVLAAVISGLDFMTASVYSAASGLPPYGYGSWWDWEIGAPQSLLDTANLVYPALTPVQIANYCAAVDHFVPDPTLLLQASGTTVSTGANRLDLCRVAIIRGALGDDASKIAQGVAGISPTLAFTVGAPGSYADGLYADGSFLQHGGTGYTGTYGGVWLGDVVKLMAALNGTPWAVSGPDVGNVFFAATNCFAPVVYNGLMLDSVRGRAIARSGEPDSADGIAAAQNLIILAGGAPDTATATRLRSIAKGWLQRTPADITGSSIATIALAQQVLTDATVPAAPEPQGHSLFPVMGRAVHRRPGWAAAISMNSSRNPFYETDGASNLRGWHTTDGMTYLYLDGDNTQYDDYFWPTVDPYRLPGTTASLLPLTDGQGGAYTGPRPATTWAGGTSDGEYAALGQDLQGPFSTLRAKKSWFCLDDAVVCLGADITCTDDTEVDSVIDNRNLHVSGTNTLTVDGTAQPTTQGWTQTFDQARWAHLDGQAGYVFPGGAHVTALREQRTGAWSAIAKGDATPAATRNYLTLWFDHGTNPVAQDYSYILMPSARLRHVAERAADRDWLHVLANTGDQQGVAVPSRGLTAVNFFAAGTAGPLTASAPTSVLIREHRDGTATICVSDPTRQATALTVTWDRPVRTVLEQPGSLASATTGRSLQLVFGDLTGLAGATQQITVRLH